MHVLGAFTSTVCKTSYAVNLGLSVWYNMCTQIPGFFVDGVGILLHCQYQGLYNVEIVQTTEAVMVEVLPGGTNENQKNMSE